MPKSFHDKKVSIVGLGYIGLPTAAVFAANGVNVIGVDVNKHAVDTINRGSIHIVEPGLEAVVQKVVREGRLRAVLKTEPADAFVIAVPTPFKHGHEPDLSYVQAACTAIAPVLKKGDLVILESTSPVGTTEQMAGYLADNRADLSFPQQAGEDSDIRIAHSPERVLPGRVLEELIDNDRVIGGMTPACSRRAVALYRTFVRGECLITTARTAEMCKLTENSFRDVNIAFANELSVICQKLEINVWDLIVLANRHPRVNILQPGPGVGGHCIAVDPWFIINRSPNEAKLIKTAREVNDGKPEWVLEKVRVAVEKSRRQPKEISKRNVRVALLGLAFKPDIDDLRESPAIQIAKRIGDWEDVDLLMVEPNIQTLPEDLKGGELTDLSTAVTSCDVLVILVAHKEFRSFEFDSESQQIIDTVGVAPAANKLENSSKELTDQFSQAALVAAA